MHEQTSSDFHSGQDQLFTSPQSKILRAVFKITFFLFTVFLPRSVQGVRGERVLCGRVHERIRLEVQPESKLPL